MVNTFHSFWATLPDWFKWVTVAGGGVTVPPPVAVQVIFAVKVEAA
jgi:hypothetical protein